MQCGRPRHRPRVSPSPSRARARLPKDFTQRAREVLVSQTRYLIALRQNHIGTEHTGEVLSGGPSRHPPRWARRPAPDGRARSTSWPRGASPARDTPHCDELPSTEPQQTTRYQINSPRTSTRLPRRIPPFLTDVSPMRVGWREPSANPRRAPSAAGIATASTTPARRGTPSTECRHPSQTPPRRPRSTHSAVPPLHTIRPSRRRRRGASRDASRHPRGDPQDTDRRTIHPPRRTTSAVRSKHKCSKTNRTRHRRAESPREPKTTRTSSRTPTTSTHPPEGGTSRARGRTRAWSTTT